MKDYSRILLVEDNDNDIELTLEAFSQYNLFNQVDVCHDGAEALDYLYCKNKYIDRPTKNPILIMLDNKMPKVTGMEVLRAIKNDDNLKNIPVIMLTSSEIDKDIMESYNLGVNAYVVKPVDFTEFIDAVKAVGIFWVMLNKTPL